MFSPDKDANRRTCVLIESERDWTGPNGHLQDKDTKRSFILLIGNDDIYVPFCLLVVFEPKQRWNGSDKIIRNSAYALVYAESYSVCGGLHSLQCPGLAMSSPGRVTRLKGPVVS
jgi:hypothetical protein